MSRAELATAVNTELHGLNVKDQDIDANYVGKLEQGKIRYPREESRRSAFRRALGALSDTDLGFSPFRRSPIDPPLAAGHRLRDTMSLPATHAPVAAPADLGTWQDTLDSLAADVSLFGTSGIYERAATHFRALHQSPRSTFSSAGAQHHALARWSEFMSWICDNEGLDEAAWWLSQAYDHAVNSDQPHFAAYVLMRQSQRALDGSDARTAVTRIKIALAEVGLPTRTQALCMTRLAEGLALAGDDTSLDLAGAAARYTATEDESPAGGVAQHCDTRYVKAVLGRCYSLLGKHTDAVHILEDVLADESPAPAVDRSLWLTHLADALRPTRPERAATAGQQALAMSPRSGSARLLRALQPLAIELRQHRELPAVTRFLSAHREALTAGLTG